MVCGVRNVGVVADVEENEVGGGDVGREELPCWFCEVLFRCSRAAIRSLRFRGWACGLDDMKAQEITSVHD